MAAFLSFYDQFFQVDMLLCFRLLLYELSNAQQTLLRTKQLHALLVHFRLSCEPFYATKMVRLYGLNGDFDNLRRVFDRCDHKSVFLWNSNIRAYARAWRFKEAFSMFNAMLRSEIRPDNFSYACVIRACCESGDGAGLRLLHGGAVVTGLGLDQTCNSALVVAYSKLGFVEEAGRVFGVISEPDLVMWNAIISSYSNCGLPEQGLKMFAEMRWLNERPDGYTLVGLISGLKATDGIHIGEGIHGFCLKSGFESNRHVGSALLNMYMRFECMDSAQKVLTSFISPDLVTWSALISGYCKYKEYEKAVFFFKKMMGTFGKKPDIVLIVSVLAAAAHLASMRLGIELHGFVLRHGLESDVMVSSALIQMYSKCGLLHSGRHLFEEMPQRNIISYNAIIQGLGLHGLADECFKLLDQMLKTGLQPGSCTFAALLCACCHAGFVEDGREIFKRMEDEFHIHPEVEHYVHMVKLLGTAGEFNEAYMLINSLPEPVDPGIWGALLSCCELHGNSEMAEVVAEKLFKIDADKGAYRVILHKVYAQDGRWDNANEVRYEMMNSGIRKTPGLSWVGSETPA